MSLPVKAIEAFSLGDAVATLDEVVAAYKEHGVLVIRGLNPTLDQQVAVAQALGDVFNWNVHSGLDISELSSAIYVGGHSDRDDRDYSQTKEDYVLDWHIEQVYYVDPILAGIWNMTNFTASPEAGTTRFVDSIVLYEMLPPEDQDFISKAVVVWEKPMSSGSGPFYTKVVDAHPISGRLQLRVETDHGCYRMPELHSWDGKAPTEEQVERYNEIWSWLKSELVHNEDIRYVQNWQQGDLLIVDLFRMYHAVMGGYKLGERTFTGIGVRPRNFKQDLYISEDLV